jgi:NAD(P)H-flavin reductase
LKEPIELDITQIDKHTSDVWSFFMLPRKPATQDFTAGQVAVLEAEGRKSCYLAFASAPEDEEYEFLVKRGAPESVAGALFESEGKGLALRLSQIVGQGFRVEEYKGSDLVFVAMGTGVAPLRSALRHVFHARSDYGRLIVLYGSRTIDDFCYAEEMDLQWREHGVELRQVISRPDVRDWSGPTGYVQSLLDHLVPELASPVAMVCGSSEMIAQTRTRLGELGFPPDRVLTNY